MVTLLSGDDWVKEKECIITSCGSLMCCALEKVDFIEGNWETPYHRLVVYRVTDGDTAVINAILRAK
jgi:hypothetical protein